MTKKPKFCPYCGEAFNGSHACTHMQQYSDNIIQLPNKEQKEEVIKEKMAFDDDGTKYREAGTEEVIIPEYGMCEICLKPKRLDILKIIYIEVPSYMSIITGQTVIPQLACPKCIKTANEE